jgi:hypothetical protein
MPTLGKPTNAPVSELWLLTDSGRSRMIPEIAWALLPFIFGN